MAMKKNTSKLIKTNPLLVKDYVITYTNDISSLARQRHYDIQFKQRRWHPHPQCLLILCYPSERCVASPTLPVAAFSPDTAIMRQDIFTCVVSLPAQVADAEQARMMEDSLKYKALQTF